MEPSTSVSLNSKSSTSTGFSSTSFFFRASSYAGRPFTFFAEKIGGICAKRPMRSAAKTFQRRGVKGWRCIGTLCLAIRIVGIGGKAKTKSSGVAFATARIELNQPRGAAEQNHQNACGQRIERAKVANLTKAGQVADGIHDVVRCFALWLVNDKGSIKRSGLWFPAHFSSSDES